MKRLIERWQIPTDHFDPNWARRGPRSGRTPLADILVQNSTYSRPHLKRRLFQAGLKSRRCELCGQGEIWRGRRMGLILDHINGNGTDNRLENLRIVCPNCAATLETHCGRKNARPLAERDCARCQATFQPRYPSQRYCCGACGSRHPNRRRGPQPHRRIVERPAYDRLLSETEQLGYSATGRRYGVSDNAIRKWLRQYQREASAAARGAARG